VRFSNMSQNLFCWVTDCEGSSSNENLEFFKFPRDPLLYVWRFVFCFVKNAVLCLYISYNGPYTTPYGYFYSIQDKHIQLFDVYQWCSAAGLKTCYHSSKLSYVCYIHSYYICRSCKNVNIFSVFVFVWFFFCFWTLSYN
jgi:hypothetical protein